MSFENVRDALVYSFADGYIDEEEFLLLYDAYSSVNPKYPYWEYDDFDLDSLDSSECISDFRVDKNDIPLLADVLGVPQVFKCPQGTICSGLEVHLQKEVKPKTAQQRNKYVNLYVFTANSTGFTSNDTSHRNS
ncbi:hypothetical protein AC249_AIPGENE22737 [Exaiptasia diaphana]|nr:hypothetical protein AC249_AIPGENE22737 [Exaiptasia diaphana]